MFTQKQIEEIVDLLYTLDENTKIYIGTDSVRYKDNGRWYAKYATVCVIHKNGKNGCQVFKHRSVEPDYDMKKSRPALRMMNEVMKSCELYIQLAPFVDEFEIFVHVDINTDAKHGSNCAYSAAGGYILGVTGLPETHVMFKPNAPSASFAADHYAHNGSR